MMRIRKCELFLDNSFATGADTWRGVSQYRTVDQRGKTKRSFGLIFGVKKAT